MTLTKEELGQYKALYKKEYGIDLTDVQAFDKGSRLVWLLKVVLQVTYESEKKIRPETSKGI